MITYYIKKYCFEYVSRHLFLKRRNFSLCVHFWNISFLVFKVFEFDLKAFIISKLSVKHRLHFLEFWLYEFANVLIDQSILKLVFFPFCLLMKSESFVLALSLTKELLCVLHLFLKVVEARPI